MTFSSATRVSQRPHLPTPPEHVVPKSFCAAPAAEAAEPLVRPFFVPVGTFGPPGGRSAVVVEGERGVTAVGTVEGLVAIPAAPIIGLGHGRPWREG